MDAAVSLAQGMNAAGRCGPSRTADSALRHGQRALLAKISAEVTGPGSDKVRRLARQARLNADNPLAKDAHRYNLLVAEGWLVFRFTWEQVMLRPDEVRRILVRAVRHQALRLQLLDDTRTQVTVTRRSVA